jgi:hypothetical protein
MTPKQLIDFLNQFLNDQIRKPSLTPSSIIPNGAFGNTQPATRQDFIGAEGLLLNRGMKYGETTFQDMIDILNNEIKSAK